MEHSISVADFSVTPGPRLKVEGAFSGELFRETVLKPAFENAIQKGNKLTVNLDGTLGYGTSFLEEAFGGLAREKEVKSVLNNLAIIATEEPYLVEDIKEYIAKANG